jgi:hypothetical protein
MNYCELDALEGEYLPITMIFKKEGGDSSAITATANVLEEIARHQTLFVAGKPEGGSHPWVKYDVFSKRNKYLYLSEKCSDSFRRTRTFRNTSLSMVAPRSPAALSRKAETAAEAPTEKRRRLNGKSADGALDVAPVPPPSKTSAGDDTLPRAATRRSGGDRAAPARKSTPTTKGEGARGDGGGAGGGGSSGMSYKDFTADFKSWDRLKLVLATTTTQASDILHVIENDATHSQLNTPVVLTPVKVALSTINDFKLSSGFIKAWVTEPKFQDYAKKAYSPKQITTERETMAKLAGMIKILDKEVTVLLGMKACRA